MMFSRGSVNEYLVSEAVSDAVVRTDTSWSDWWSSGKRNPASHGANVKQTETPERQLLLQIDIGNRLRSLLDQERHNYNSLATKYNADLTTAGTEIANLRKTIRINEQHLERNQTDIVEVQNQAFKEIKSLQGKIHSLEKTLENLQGYA